MNAPRTVTVHTTPSSEQRQADEALRRARENDQRAKAAGTLRPIPYGITRPLLSMGGAR